VNVVPGSGSGSLSRRRGRGDGGDAASGRSSKGSAGSDKTGDLGGFGRYAGPATLILSSLAEGPKHGYVLTKDVEAFSGVRLAPGTLYEALVRLEERGLIEAVESDDRRRPYRLTPTGAEALKVHLGAQRRVADLGLKRLARNWAPT
jgi:DNA-binding PadR family transcriptional regulator